MIDSVRQPFNLKRNDPCFCPSGQRFKHCCGSSRPDRPTPYGIKIVEDFLSASECEDLLAVSRDLPAHRLKLMDEENTNAQQVVRKYDDNRITQRVDMTGHQQILDNLVARALTEVIEPDLGQRFDWFEQPQLLRYETGGFYTHHADCEHIDRETGHWHRVVDRDISLLLYLDEDFTGGELLFSNFEFRIKPRPGLLVYFPSDSRYLHKALEVTAGSRHAIVSWLSQHGVPKLRPPPDDAILQSIVQH